MISAMENILQSYFHRSTLEEVDIREVEQWASQYPYFAQAQFLLAKKYLQSGHPDYKKQVAKTALFFNNPHWLHQLLSDQLFTKSAFNDNFITGTIAPEEVSHTNIAGIEEEENALPLEPVVEEEPQEFAREEQIPEHTVVAEEPTSDIAGQTIVVEQEEVKAHIAEEELVELKDEPVVVTDITVVEEAENIPAEIALLTPEDDILLETPPSEFADDEIAEQPDTKQKQPLITEEKMRSILPKFPFEKISIANETAADGGIIPIEPLHTIDYFASQGIKLREAEVEGKDKLSVKLKSFTEWLKTMKRIHPEKLEKEEAEQAQSIQNMAEHSNDNNDVLTEAMAEVFARQGLHHKAIDVYQKLSLLNPHKKAYFAAKISKLNDN